MHGAFYVICSRVSSQFVTPLVMMEGTMGRRCDEKCVKENDFDAVDGMNRKLMILK